MNLQVYSNKIQETLAIIELCLSKDIIWLNSWSVNQSVINKIY